MTRRTSRIFADGDDLDDVRVGDVVHFMGQPHLITRIEPYDPARLGPRFAGLRWCFAWAEVKGARPWGITITSDAPLRAQEDNP